MPNKNYIAARLGGELEQLVDSWACQHTARVLGRSEMSLDIGPQHLEGFAVRWRGMEQTWKPNQRDTERAPVVESDPNLCIVKIDGGRPRFTRHAGPIHFVPIIR